MSIYIIGEAWGEREEAAGRPFVGPSGQVLDGLLAANGIDRRSCIIDNVFNFRPARNEIETLMTKEQVYAAPGLPPFKPKMWLHRDHLHHVLELRERIKAARPNIVLALGNTPLWACVGATGIKKHRGSPMLCSFAPIKLIATYHPAAILRQWNIRPITFMDFAKAKEQSAFPEFTRPRRFIHFAPTLEEIEDFYYDYIVPSPRVSCDVETKGHQITEVGFAPTPDRAIVIPFYSRSQRDGNYWRTFEEEKLAWGWVRRVLDEKHVVGQNFQYDAQYFLRRMGIPCPLWDEDTMLLAHSLQPEMEKGLGFLGSIYTTEPAWKFMRTDHAETAGEELK